jgi:hypothetical protein
METGFSIRFDKGFPRCAFWTEGVKWARAPRFRRELVASRRHKHALLD